VARIQCTITYDAGSQKANVTELVLQIDKNDHVVFATQDPNLVIKFKDGYSPSKLSPGQVYQVPHTKPAGREAGVPFECGRLVNGKFEPYKEGGEAPGGGPGGL
jgi:hypothetical protein